MYLASSEGRIFGIFRLQITNGFVGKKGRVWLSGPKEWAHRMVAEAFLGPCPKGLEVCHGDGNPINNRVGNLRYDTHRNNMLDAIQHGTFMGGAA